MVMVIIRLSINQRFIYVKQIDMQNQSILV